MSTKNVEIINTVYKTMERKKLRDFLHPDLIVEEPVSLPYGGTYRGRDEFLFTLMPRVWEAWGNQGFDVDAVIDADPWVIGMLRLRGHSSILDTDFEIPVAEFWELDDEGLITKIVPYYFDVGKLVGPYQAN